MNFETLRRLGELEHRVKEFTKRLESLEAALELIAKAEQKIKQEKERRTLTLPKKNA